MKSIRITFAVLLSFVTHFTISQEFRKSTITADPKKRKLINRTPQKKDCVEDPVKGVITGKSGTKFSSSGKTGKSGSKGVSSGKSGAKETSSGKSGKASKKDRLLKSSRGKVGVKGSDISSGSGTSVTSSSGAGKGAGLSSGQGKGSDISSGSGTSVTSSSGAGKGTSLSSGHGKGSDISSGSGKGVTSSSGAGKGTSLSSGHGKGNDISSGSGKDVTSSSGAGKGTGLSSGQGKGIDTYSGSGKGGNVFAITGKGGSTTAKCNTPSPVIPPSTSPIPRNPEPEFDLKVINGSGDGTYIIGTEVTIIAEEKENKIFREWKVNKGPSGIITNAGSKRTTLTMRNQNVIVKAFYNDANTPEPEFNLEVINGSGDGTYITGTKVTIIAEEKENKVFKEWKVNKGPSEIIAKAGAKRTKLTMRNQNVIVEAFYGDANTPPTEFNLNVINGSGTGFYEEGSMNIITAIDPSPTLGGKFTGWKIFDRLSGIITNLDSETTNLIMPAEDVTVEAEFSYDLTVTDGSGDGPYSAGERVVVTAIPPTPGSIFIRWNIVSGPPGIIVNEDATTSILNMPAQNVRVEALFEIKYELIVTNGSGDGRYTFGTEVNIDADPPSSGQSLSSFTEWIIIKGPEGIIGNKFLGSTNVNMPPEDVTIRAIYFR